MMAREQTSRYLLLAVIITVFSGMLGLITLVMAWEFWMIPLMAAGCFCISQKWARAFFMKIFAPD